MRPRRSTVLIALPWVAAGILLCGGCAQMGGGELPPGALSDQFRRVGSMAASKIVHIQVSGGKLSEARRKKLRDEYHKENPFDLWGGSDFESALRSYDLPPGTGSGMVYSTNGIIITCFHVIEERPSIRVVLGDGREAVAKVLATDPDSDIAVLKTDLVGLEPMTFARTREINLGDWVVCVGAPFGLTHTITHGIVSSVGRENLKGLMAKYQGYVQTDAPVHPGSSGGALLSLSGDVVGMVTAAAPLNQAMSAGIGFCIPSDRVAKTVDQLLTKGRTTRPWIGVMLHDLTRGDADVLGIREGGGALILAVAKGGPASRAGIVPEDCVVAVDHAPVKTINEFLNRLSGYELGAKVRFDIVRETQRLAVTIELAPSPEDPSQTVMEGGCVIGDIFVVASTALSGMKRKANFFYPPGGSVETRAEDGRGVIVDYLGKKASAALKVGDWIMEANGKPTQSVHDLRTLIAEMKSGENLRLKVEREGEDMIEVVIPMAAQPAGGAQSPPQHQK